MAQYRANDPEMARLKQKAWRDNNIDVRRQVEREYSRRRFFWCKANKLRGSEKANYKELASLWRVQNGLCALTGRKLTRSAHLDHIVPKSKGGLDNLGNLRWVCQEANLAKRDLLDAELLDLCRDIVSMLSTYID